MALEEGLGQTIYFSDRPDRWVDLRNLTFAECNGACHTRNFCSRDSIFYDTYCPGQVDGS